MRNKTWNVLGNCAIEITRDACPLADLEPLVRGETAELLISFRAVGWSRPASMYGGPDRLGWPAEGDEERTLVCVWLVQDGLLDQELPPALAQEVFERFEDEVLAADVEWDDRE